MNEETKNTLDYINEFMNAPLEQIYLNRKRIKLVLNYITDLQQENARLKDKFKDLEEWLEAMVKMYENEYKDVDASEHYKCILHKLKEN